MILRLLHSRQLVASFLAAATGMALYFRVPFPEANLFLQVMAVRSTAAFLFFKYSYTLFLYTTPFIGFSILFSGMYIFALKSRALVRGVQHRFSAQQSVRPEQGTVLAAGLHQPRQIHHPAAQSRFRLRDTFRRLRMRDQPRSAGTENRRSRKETGRSGFGASQRRRIFEVSARPRAIPFPARFRIEPLSGGVYAGLSGSVERQRDSVGSRERL